MNRYAVVMAGGSGTRLWPLSRSSQPKQFQSLVGDETLIQSMWRYLRQVLPTESIFVMAAPQFESLVRQQLPELLVDHLLYEPSPKDTGPAILLAAAEMLARDDDSVLGIFWSDHLIRQPDAFARSIKAAYAAVEEQPDQIVGVGVKPTQADPGLGYIKMGQSVGRYNGVSVFQVEQAVEKPDLETASQFVQSSAYLWNTGYKVFRPELLLQAARERIPDLADQLQTIQSALGSADEKSRIDAAWQAFPKKSIELLLTDQLKNQLVVPADLGWSDVGNWKTLHDVLSTDETSVISRGNHLSHDDKNVLAYAKNKLVVTVGLRDIVVVETDDVILVAHKDKAQEIKQIVEQLKQANKTEYL